MDKVSARQLTRQLILVGVYSVTFGIGLYLILAGKDWRGYAALLTTPVLHWLIRGIGK